MPCLPPTATNALPDETQIRESGDALIAVRSNEAVEAQQITGYQFDEGHVQFETIDDNAHTPCRATANRPVGLAPRPPRDPPPSKSSRAGARGTDDRGFDASVCAMDGARGRLKVDAER